MRNGRGGHGIGIVALSMSCGLAAVVLLSGATTEVVYRDGPPPGFTGGFGEESCAGCHFDQPMNDSAGTFRLSGVPSVYEAGKSYPIIVALARRGMEAGGFQLSARLQGDGVQAGALAIDPPDMTRLALITDRGVQYLHQRHAGSAPGASDTLVWTAMWTAPEGDGVVVFHASANAADGDGSASGDFVYTAEVVSQGH